MPRNLLELRNAFTKENFPPNPETNRSEVPIESIQEWLTQNFPGGFSYEVTQAGTLGNGHNFVCIKLKVETDSGMVTVAGAADAGPFQNGKMIGPAGLIMLALRNAVLRGLQAGLDLYEYEEGKEPVFQDRPANQSQQTYRPVSNNQPKPSGGGFGPWTGEVKVKSGYWQNTAWKDIPQDSLEQMAGNGINLAIMETKRRQEASPSEGFPPRAFSR